MLRSWGRKPCPRPMEYGPDRPDLIEILETTYCYEFCSYTVSVNLNLGRSTRRPSVRRNQQRLCAEEAHVTVDKVFLLWSCDVWSVSAVYESITVSPPMRHYSRRRRHVPHVRHNKRDIMTSGERENMLCSESYLEVLSIQSRLFWGLSCDLSVHFRYVLYTQEPRKFTVKAPAGDRLRRNGRQSHGDIGRHDLQGTSAIQSQRESCGIISTSRINYPGDLGPHCCKWQLVGRSRFRIYRSQVWLRTSSLWVGPDSSKTWNLRDCGHGCMGLSRNFNASMWVDVKVRGQPAFIFVPPTLLSLWISCRANFLRH